MATKKKGDQTAPRLIPLGSCTWCGHKPHPKRCRTTIRTSVKGDTGPCGCPKLVAA